MGNLLVLISFNPDKFGSFHPEGKERELSLHSNSKRIRKRINGFSVPTKRSEKHFFSQPINSSKKRFYSLQGQR
jgi:hypothetical protein